jgi:hypothetical protein
MCNPPKKVEFLDAWVVELTGMYSYVYSASVVCKFNDGLFKLLVLLNCTSTLWF